MAVNLSSTWARNQQSGISRHPERRILKTNKQNYNETNSDPGTPDNNPDWVY